MPAARHETVLMLPSHEALLLLGYLGEGLWLWGAAHHTDDPLSMSPGAVVRLCAGWLGRTCSCCHTDTASASMHVL